jgi:tetratricopeptide (TPR) repeat protein
LIFLLFFDGSPLSSRKDKLLESAQKFIAKGQVDRAIKDYQQIVAADQGDIRNRQRLAELLVRVNRKEDAITEYEAIGKHYSDNAFYLKAIAVYKQIQKLDPANIKITLTLASLNERQGLIGNALAEYNLALNFYQKAGSLPDALKVIEKMLAADPENLNTQLKFAETYFSSGLAEKAYREFTQLALNLRKRGDETAFTRVCERVQALYPQQQEFVLDILAMQVEEGDAAGALPCLQKLSKSDAANPKVWKLLADAYFKTGEAEGRKAALLEIVKLVPSDLTAIEGAVQTAIDAGNTDGALELMKEYHPRLAAEGAFETLERFYAALREIAPTDPRVLRGLKDVYAATGAREKVDELTDVIDSLQQQEKLPAEEPENLPLQAAPEPPAAPLPAEQVGGGQEMAWEEEIDLSLHDEEGTDDLPGDAGELAAPPDEPVPGADDFLLGSGIDFSSAETEEPQPAPGEVNPAPADTFPEDELLVEAEELTELDLEIGEHESDWLQGVEAPATTGDDEWRGEAEPGEGIPGAAEPGSIAAESEDLIPPEAQLAEEGGLLDLEMELTLDDFAEEPPVLEKQRKNDLDGQFIEFKRGMIDQQLDEGDTETHFNLGIAYKEMGLFDDAIPEFRAAAADPRRKIDCLTLEGICCRDKGDFTCAEEAFQGALATSGLTDEASLSLNYELAFLYESAGRLENALHYYRQVRAADARFRDVAQKIKLLGDDQSNEPEESELLELDVEDSE